MRRKEKEIIDPIEMESILNTASIIRLGLMDKDFPYVVPLCFGYRDTNIYVHGAHKGKKMDLIRANPNVCFETDLDTEVVPGKKPCSWTMTFKSVIGYGKATILEDPDEKRQGLEVIMAHYAHGLETGFSEPELKSTAVIKIQIFKMTGKKSTL